MYGWLVEGQAFADVSWSFVMQGIVCVGQHLELALLLDRESVQLLEMGCAVGLSGEVEDGSSRCVLYCL